MRFIVVLEESGYTINADGNAEMTNAAQKEYDDFVSKIRQDVTSREIQIIDEGYGSDEDELEWHITFWSGVPEHECAGILEIDTCVRTEKSEE